MILKLTTDQILSFRKFLIETTKEAPKNFIEWGEDYMQCCVLRDHFEKFIIRESLICNADYYYSAMNWLAAYVNEIKDKKLGEELFNEMKDLFIVVHNEIGSKYPYWIMISSLYDSKPREVILVDPSRNPEDFFANLLE